VGLLKDPEAVVGRLAAALDMPVSELRAKTRSGRRSEWLKRKMSYDETERLRGLKIPAVAIVPDEQRIYPNGDLARPVLGAVRLDGNGAAGIEFEFNRSLIGRSRRVELTRDVAGEPIVLKDSSDKAAGPPDLRLALDRNVQFLAESAFLSFAGGALGVMLGILTATVVTHFARWPTMVQPQAVVLAFSFATAIGLFFGYYPALRAAGLDPVEALRYE
jgi:cell division protein FtsI/penicillin-binding protein 2